jgi:hypothetical protein
MWYAYTTAGRGDVTMPQYLAAHSGFGTCVKEHLLAQAASGGHVLVMTWLLDQGVQPFDACAAAAEHGQLAA